jgi:oligosaccharyltransferase complex subunit beta
MSYPHVTLLMMLLCSLVFALIAMEAGSTPMTASLPNHQPISPNKRVLVLLDDANLKNVSNKYFDALTATGHKLKFKKLAEGSSVTLKTSGEYEFDNVIVFMLEDHNPTDRALVNILEFIDAGGNLLLATNGKSKWARDLAAECGIKVADNTIFDRFPPSFNEKLSVPWPKANENVLGPRPQGDARIAYSGVSTEPTAQATAMAAVRTLSASSTSFQLKSAISGSKINLITSLLMLNNARVTVSGSVFQFSDDVFEQNRLFNERLSKWTFAEASVLRIVSWGHRKTDGTEAERQVKHARHLESNLPRSHFPDPEWGPNARLYRIRDEVEFRIQIEIQGFDEKWVPFQANDIQLEFAMLDPYQRRTLSSTGGGEFKTSFTLPDQYGTFKFRVVYNRPGVSRLSVIDTVNVRPFRHDEYERFIPNAFPYYAAVGAIMVGFLLFSIAFVSVKKEHAKSE